MDTRKNTLIVDKGKQLRFISPTRNRRFHDLKLFKKEAIIPCFPKEYSIWADKGYTGIDSWLPDQVKALRPQEEREKDASYPVGNIKQ